MKVKILLEKNETQYDAEDVLIKAITSKYDTSKMPHPDPVIDEISSKFKREYDKTLVAMMAEIFEVIGESVTKSKAGSPDLVKAEVPEVTSEMIEFFEKRTKFHIDRVIANMGSIVDQTGLDREEAMKRAEDHDASKYGEIERPLYIWLTHFHRMNHDKGRKSKWTYPKGLESKVREASKHHITVNKHHPEAHKDVNDMTDLDILEMVCDFQAMSDELAQGSCRKWVDDNLDRKWNFDQEHKDKIYEYIKLLEGRNV